MDRSRPVKGFTLMRAGVLARSGARQFCVVHRRSADTRRRVRSPILQATGADHPAISCFLDDVFAGACRAEFRWAWKTLFTGRPIG